MIEFDGDGRVAWVGAVYGVSVASVRGEKDVAFGVLEQMVQWK